MRAPEEIRPKEEYACTRGGWNRPEEEYTCAPEENGMDPRRSMRARPQGKRNGPEEEFVYGSCCLSSPCDAMKQ